MKPIIVLKQGDGKIVLDEEELKEIINDSYLCGYKDGANETMQKLYERFFDRIFNAGTAEKDKKHQTLHS